MSKSFAVTGSPSQKVSVIDLSELSFSDRIRSILSKFLQLGKDEFVAPVEPRTLKIYDDIFVCELWRGRERKVSAEEVFSEKAVKKIGDAIFEKFRSEKIKTVDFLEALYCAACMLSAYVDTTEDGKEYRERKITLCLPAVGVLPIAAVLAEEIGMPIKRTIIVTRDEKESDDVCELLESIQDLGFIPSVEISEADEATENEAILDFFEEFGYVAEGRTAAALAAASDVYEDYGEIVLAVSPLSPFTAAQRVLKAIGESVPKDLSIAMKKLEEVTALPFDEE